MLIDCSNVFVCITMANRKMLGWLCFGKLNVVQDYSNGCRKQDLRK